MISPKQKVSAAIGNLLIVWAVAGCGGPSHPVAVSHSSAPHPKSTPASHSAGGNQSSSPSLKTPSTPSPTQSSPNDRHSSGQTPLAQFPALVASALRKIAGTTQIPLWGPTTLPRGNSAIAKSTQQSFTVNIFACPVAEPINSSQIGQGNCGAMASFAEGFGASEYPSPQAALDALPQSPITNLSNLQLMSQSLPGGLTAQRWVRSGSHGPGSTIALRWQEGDWTLWISGGSGLRQTAISVTEDLQHYRLPPHQGSLLIDAAPDGQHTSLSWVIGSTVYDANSMHQALHAIEIAASSQPFAPQ